MDKGGGGGEETIGKTGAAISTLTLVQRQTDREAQWVDSRSFVLELRSCPITKGGEGDKTSRCIIHQAP